MTRIRRITASAVLALAVSVPMAGAALAAPSASAGAPAAAALTGTAASVPRAFQGELPRPTGPYEAGRDTLHLVDADRTDPWVPSAGPRQLMVSMFYPARQGTGVPAPYMTFAEAQDFIQTRVPPNSGLQPQQFVDIKTHAYTDAHPEHGKFPLVVLSPGFENPRATLTSLATDLASHGYVVALVGHTYEDSGTTFPDGQTLTCAICDSGPAPGQPSVTDSRALDVSFVLDQLTRHPSAWRLSHLIDASKIGMAGHSIGGASAVSTMLADQRVRAGVNMDGTFFAPVPATGIGHRPFLMLGTQIDHNVGGSDGSWGQAWANLDGYKPWLTVAGTNHASFTDLVVLADEAGLPMPPGSTTPGARSAQITREYVDAFFDQMLKGIPQPLLAGPSAANPEVAFQQP